MVNRRVKMAELTADQITTLTNLGARRWQRGDMDRLYINAHLYASSPPGDAFVGTKAWVDVKTGLLSVRGASPEQEREARALAEKWLADAYAKVEWLVADRRAKSIKSVALKWRKGNEITIDGKRFVVARADTISSPTEDKNLMLCDARIIVPQYDGRYRRVDLNEA